MGKEPLPGRSGGADIKYSRISRMSTHSQDLHGPKPKDTDDDMKSGRGSRARQSDRKHVERASSPRAVDVFQELLGGVEPVVGMRFTDGKYGNAEFEITAIRANGNIEAQQVADGKGADGNYTLKQTLTAVGLERVSESEGVNTSESSRFAQSITPEEMAEMEALLRVAGVADAASVDVSDGGASELGERAVSEEPADQPGLNDLVFPEPGTIWGAQHGGTNVIYDDKDTITTAAVDVGADAADGSGSSDVIDNDATKAIDEQAPLAGRRRGGGKREKKKTVQDASTIEPPSTTIPPNTDSVSAMTPAETPPVNQDTVADMSFESSLSSASQQTEKTEDERYRDGSVWVEEYLKEADQAADIEKRTSGDLVSSSTPPGEERSIVDILGEDDLSQRSRNPVPTQTGANDEELVGFGAPFEPAAIVRKRDDPLHTNNIIPAIVRKRDDPRHPSNTSPDKVSNDDDFDEADPDGVAVAEPGSATEIEVARVYGRDKNWNILRDEDQETTPEGKLQERIKALASDCNRARLEYVMADNESRTVMSRLRGILGISGKGIQNETVTQKKEVYQSKLRELRDLRLELVKLTYSDRAGLGTMVDAELGGKSEEDVKDSPALEEESSLEKELEAELRHFAQEVNIGLYNAWTELRSEQKGIIGKLKQFGASYNKLSWQKKLVIGIPVAGLAVASGAGLLGTAMASAAIAAVIARRGVAAAGMFTTVDGGLQKLAESRAQKMAEKIVAQGQQEAASLETMATMSEANEGVTAGSEAAAPETNTESLNLDVKLERMKAFMDNYVINSLDRTLESRIRGQDRRRLSALAGSVGVAFGLPSFMASEMGHELTRAATEKAGTAASSVGEAVFGDDYMPNGAPTERAGAVQEVVKSANTSSDATVPARETPSSSVPEPAAKAAESVGGTAGILGKEITLVKGDSVWKLAGNMAKELGVKGEAENLYFADALKDAYLAQGGSANLKVGAVFDWKKVLSAEDMQKILEATNNLTPEQKASILANRGKNIAAAITPGGPAGGVAVSGPTSVGAAGESAGIGNNTDASVRVRDATAGATLLGDEGRRAYRIPGIRTEDITDIQGDLIVAEPSGSVANSSDTVSRAPAAETPSVAGERYINVPGMGPVNLATLESVETVLETGPAAQWTLRQLAEAAQNPGALPAGVTVADVARMREILVSIPGASTREFLAANADLPVREIIQNNVRAPIEAMRGVAI